MAGALGGVEGAPGAEKPRGVFLAFPQDAFRFEEGVGALDLGDVPAFKAQKGLPLVAGHMEPGNAALPIAPDEVYHRGVHCWVSLAAFIMMAHSMRLRNSSQPAS